MSLDNPSVSLHSNEHPTAVATRKTCIRHRFPVEPQVELVRTSGGECKRLTTTTAVLDEIRPDRQISVGNSVAKVKNMNHTQIDGLSGRQACARPALKDVS